MTIPMESITILNIYRDLFTLLFLNTGDFAPINPVYEESGYIFLTKVTTQLGKASRNDFFTVIFFFNHRYKDL